MWKVQTSFFVNPWKILFFFRNCILFNRFEINLTTIFLPCPRTCSSVSTVWNVDQDVLGGHTANYWSMLHPKWRCQQPTTLVNYLIDQQLTFPHWQLQHGGGGWRGDIGVLSCILVTPARPGGATVVTQLQREEENIFSSKWRLTTT